MRIRLTRAITISALTLIVGAVLARAANLDTSLRNAETRRKGAETRLREIKTKFRDHVAAAHPVYARAAADHNAWLDGLVRSLSEDSAPANAEQADQAAASLMGWISASDKLRGQPGSEGTGVSPVERAAAKDLIDIATETWKGNHGQSQAQRTRTVTSLNDRLRWKTWDQIN